MERQGQIVFSPTVPQAFNEAFEKEPAYKTDPTAPVPTIYTRILAPSSPDVEQYGRVAESLNALGWDNAEEILINSAKERADIVESIEFVAPLKDMGNKVGELIISPGSIQWWRAKGPILITNKLPIQPNQGRQVIVGQSVQENAVDQTEKVRVIESVGIFTNQASQLPQATFEIADQEKNPYLLAPAKLNKAA